MMQRVSKSFKVLPLWFKTCDYPQIHYQNPMDEPQRVEWVDSPLPVSRLRVRVALRAHFNSVCFQVLGSPKTFPLLLGQKLVKRTAGACKTLSHLRFVLYEFFIGKRPKIQFCTNLFGPYFLAGRYFEGLQAKRRDVMEQSLPKNDFIANRMSMVPSLSDKDKESWYWVCNSYFWTPSLFVEIKSSQSQISA